ncbi:complement C1q and tumor necrosis factor-related protein 9-like [Pecten maximus]|uniref:complement C1q and tumor necrosis factor-related protein 9-like n=1 Tax=Pecten maximus TaxID=6579 RepID=UPI001458D230|nr:complement C1q and tumor necrosis factor-related protein 9-like [Pecten maximus]
MFLSVLTSFLNIAFFVDADIDPNFQSLQNRIISLERIVQQISADFKDLEQQHTLLEYKYQALSDEIKQFRRADSGEESRINFSRMTTETSHYNERSILTKGQKGDKGDPGQRGPKGEAGTNGFNGDDGFDGQKGMKGDQARNGSKGDTGPQGVPGPTGHTGHIGVKGDKGEPGQPGSVEAKGTKMAFSVSNFETTRVNQSPIILTFDDIYSNFGDDYDSRTGSFICTTPGTYVITWATEVETKYSRTLVFTEKWKDN